MPAKQVRSFPQGFFVPAFLAVKNKNMPNPWFKFYGMEYLGDPKIETLRAGARSCWITLLCFASEHNGLIPHLSEHGLMVRSGLDPTMDGWDDNVGVLSLFQKLDMIDIDDNGLITIKNWQKRQDRSMTPYERVRKYREKKRMITHDNVNDNVVDKIRVDKIRKEKIKKEATQSVAGNETNDVIALFQKINPSYERLFGNKTERAAIDRLLKNMGREKLEGTIRFAIQVSGQPYSPTITTPYELEKNLGKLIAFYKKEKEKGQKNQIIDITK